MASLQAQKAEMIAHLAKLKGGSVKPVSLEGREKVNAEHRQWQKAANARKKIRTGVWKEIEANVEKSKVKETKEDSGWEF